MIRSILVNSRLHLQVANLNDRRSAWKAYYRT